MVKRLKLKKLVLNNRIMFEIKFKIIMTLSFFYDKIFIGDGYEKSK